MKKGGVIACRTCLLEVKKKPGDCAHAATENNLGNLNKHANIKVHEAHLAERRKKKKDRLKASKIKASSLGVVSLMRSITTSSHAFLC